MKRRDLIFAAAAVFVVLCCAKPASLWEFDEMLFAQAVQHYDPIAHHPPPPGYPLFILVAKIVRLFTPGDFAALVTLSIIASTLGFILLALALARITDRPVGLAGALIFYLSPAMLVHSTLALSEPGAFALLAAALFFARSSPFLFGVFAALSIGWRPQFCFFVVPLVLLIEPRSIRKFIAFAVTCLAWLIPLTLALGGPQKLIAFESGQARYLAQHDAGLSRITWSLSSIVIHFVSHPWGPKVMALPVFAAAAYGVWRLRRERMAVAVGVAGLAYIAIAIAIMDPADGVRYALPFCLAVAMFAGAGAVRVSRWTPVLFGAASIIYVSSLIVQRASSASPPAQAAAMIPSNAAVGYELSLWPHATYFFGARRAVRIDDAVQRFFDRPDVPVFAYINGTTDLPNARTSRWETSDAYWNLTRNFYRIVSIAPVGPDRRYRVIRGVYTQEREADAIAIAGHGDITGDVWHWTDGDAAIEMPRASAVTLRIGLPKSFAYPANRVTLIADGRSLSTVDLQRGEKRTIGLRFPAPSRVLEIKADRAVRPANDPRTLAVALYDIEFGLARRPPPRPLATLGVTSFESALLGFNPYLHRPPPPSYPLYIALGKLVNFFVHNAHVSLVAISVAGTLIAFVLLVRRFRGWFALVALVAVIPLATAPDHAAIACFAIALTAANPLLAGAAAGATVGMVPQTVAGVLLFLLAIERRWRAWIAFLVVLLIEFMQAVQNIELGRMSAFVRANMDLRHLFDPASSYVVPIVVGIAVAYHQLLEDGKARHLARGPDVQRGSEH